MDVGIPITQFLDTAGLFSLNYRKKKRKITLEFAQKEEKNIMKIFCTKGLCYT